MFTETIIVAVITFASGSIGALLGVIGSVISARINAKTKFGESLYLSRSSAYKNFLDAAVDFERNFNDLEKLSVLHSARNAADLMASELTRQRISDFMEKIQSRDFMSDDSRRIRCELVVAMQKDLLNLPKVKIRKRQESQKSGKELPILRRFHTRKSSR